MWAASCASLWRDAHAGRLTAGMASDAYPVRPVPPRPTPHTASGGVIMRVDTTGPWSSTAGSLYAGPRRACRLTKALLRSGLV